MHSPARVLAVRTHSLPRYGLALTIGAVAAGLWFLCLLVPVILWSEPWSFVAKWNRLQGFPVLTVGIALALVADSSSLYRLAWRLLDTTGRRALRPKLARVRRVRYAVVGLVASVGGASLIGLGFAGDLVQATALALTSVLVCFLAAIATAHGLEILWLCGGYLRAAHVTVFTYAPAETTTLKRLASYTTNYGLVLTAGYVLTVLATFLSSWEADLAYVRTVQLAWPALYVPFTLTLLVYPHLVFHRIIRAHKESLMESCQSRIQELLAGSADLRRSEVERSNAWADLFERVRKTPDFAIDFGIAARTVVPVVMNILTLLPNKTVLGNAVQRYLAGLVAS